jgi:hypothetical protein
MNPFATFLLDVTQRDEFSLGPETDFLLKLALGGAQQFFPRFNLTFGNRPIAVVFAGEKGSPRMGEEHLEAVAVHPVHHQPGTDLAGSHG